MRRLHAQFREFELFLQLIVRVDALVLNCISLLHCLLVIGLNVTNVLLGKVQVIRQSLHFSFGVGRVAAWLGFIMRLTNGALQFKIRLLQLLQLLVRGSGCLLHFLY